MAYKLQPIEYFGNVNDFQPIPVWEVSHGSPMNLYFVLQKVDKLGPRRYLPPPGSTVSVSFLRARPATTGSAAMIVTKSAVAVSADDRSMFRIDMTQADTTAAVSGGITLTITTSGVASTYNVPYIVKKIISTPGY